MENEKEMNLGYNMDRMNILLVNSVNIAMKKTEVLLVGKINIE